jgi:hypothetical protein
MLGEVFVMRYFLIFALYKNDDNYYYTLSGVLELEKFPNKIECEYFAKYLGFGKFEDITSITELSYDDYKSWVS